jgi:hypothetical protein
MARQRFTHRLPETRITEQLYRAMHNAAKDNESRLTDLIRAALEQFFTDDIDTAAGFDPSFAVPVVGMLTDKGITLKPTPLTRKHLALYLEVEPVGGGG